MADILGGVASVMQITEWAAKGWQTLVGKQPEYAHYWKRFEKTLSPEFRDVPWDQLSARYRLSPEYIGQIGRLIRGEHEVLNEIEASYREHLTPSEGSRYDQDEMIEKLMEVTRLSAAHAVQDMADAFIQSTGLLTGEIRASESRVVREIDAHREETQAAEHRVTEHVSAETGALSDELRSIVREELALEHAARLSDEALPDRRPSVGREAAAPNVRSPALDVATSGDSGLSPDELVEQLSGEDCEGSQRLRQLLESGGPHAVVLALREREGPEDDGVAFLVTGARIAHRAGAFAEAEAAYIWASEVPGTSETMRARQLVRAAAMAQLTGDGRFEELLDRADTLSPGHPGVALARARETRDPHEMLALARDVAPENDAEAALLHVIRGQAHFALGDEVAADAELREAKDAQADSIAVREFSALLAIGRAHKRLHDGQQADQAALDTASGELQSLQRELERQGRWDEAAHIASRASQGFAFAERFDDAVAVLNGVKRVENLSGDSRRALGEAALQARHPELVGTFVRPGDDSLDARVLRAEAAVLGHIEGEEEDAIAELRGLLQEDDESVRRRAAFALLSGAAEIEGVEWSDEAATIVADLNPTVAAMLGASYSNARGDLPGAERRLLPHSDHPLALRLLRDAAAQNGEWQKAADRSRLLLQADPTDEDRLRDADIRLRTGDRAGAKTGFLELARDRSASMAIREEAYGRACEIATDVSDFADAKTISLEWRETLPDSTNAIWNLLYSLARLSDWDTAYQLMRESAPEPTKLVQARLAVGILNRAAPKAEAVEEIERLSSQFDASDAALEGLLIVSGLEAEQAGVQLPDALAEEVGRRFRSYTDRFPESEFMRAIPAPQTPEDFDALMHEIHGASAAAQKAAQAQVAAGEAPVNVLAAVSPLTALSRAWGRLSALPMSYASPPPDDADREAAREALGGAAVWDPSAIVVAGGLGAEIEDAIRTALPGSLIANETREDADTFAGGLPPGTGEMGLDPDTGHGFLRDVGEAEREREQFMAEGVLRIATELEVRPATGDEGSPQMKELLAKDDTHPALRVLFASLLLAQQVDRPVYSDDRWIRNAARGLGLKAFGTLALLDVLAADGLLTHEQRASARRRLAASGAWGVQLTSDELEAEAAAADWELTPALAGGLLDRAAWRGNLGHRWFEAARFLGRVCANKPELLRSWARRYVDAAVTAWPEAPAGFQAQAMLIAAWDVDEQTQEMPDECFQALVREMRALPVWLRTPGFDPVLGAMDRVLSAFAGATAVERYALFVRLFRRLSLPDQARAWQAFVR